MSKLHVFCRNPNCWARFSQTTKAESRPLPADKVDAAAIAAYYKGHPDEATHRSPDRVCVDCRLHVRSPKWRPEHMYAPCCFPSFSFYFSPLLFPVLFLFIPACFFIDCVSLVRPPSSVPAAGPVSLSGPPGPQGPPVPPPAFNPAHLYARFLHFPFTTSSRVPC